MQTETWEEKRAREKQAERDQKKEKREQHYGWLRDHVGKEVYEYRLDKMKPIDIYIRAIVKVSPSASKITIRNPDNERTQEFLPDDYFNSGYKRKFAPLDDPTISKAYAAQEQAKADVETAKDQAAQARADKIAAGGMSGDLAPYIGETLPSPGPWALMPRDGSFCRGMEVLSSDGEVVFELPFWTHGGGEDLEATMRRDGNQLCLANMALITAAPSLLRILRHALNGTATTDEMAKAIALAEGNEGADLTIGEK